MGPVTPLQAWVLVAVGLSLTVVAVTWLAGPWGLLGCGVALVLAGLLLPVKERRGEPVDEPVAPL